MELQKYTLKMLSASVGFKYTEKEIYERVHFVMSECTAHNIGISDELCSELNISDDDRADTLVREAHPLMMCNRGINVIYDEIHDGIQELRITKSARLWGTIYCMTLVVTPMTLYHTLPIT